MTTLYDHNIPLGITVNGTWNKGRYVVKRLLGEGANGKVYLVGSGNRHLFAMKLGFDPLDLQSEVNVLRSLFKGQKTSDRFLFDFDDFEYEGRKYSFYIMKFVDGVSIPNYLHAHGEAWFPLIAYNILRKLRELHAQGWIFGDLKLENVLVTGYGDVELVDYGGVSRIGRSVKQFTAVYDRGYWSAGNRKADESYDLFSFAVLCIQATDESKRIEQSGQLLPQFRTVDYLIETLRVNKRCVPVASVLQPMLLGKLVRTSEACARWRTCMLRFKLSSPKHRPHRRGNRGMRWLGGFFVASVILFAAVVYLTFS